MGKISSSEKRAGALGLAATAVAAVAAGYYFYGKGGKGHRKQASAWSKKAKMEMLRQIKQMKVVSWTAYHKAAREVLAKYNLAKNIDPLELQNFGQELKAHWVQISKEAGELSRKGKAKKATIKR
jgi:hypothetical protein